MKVRMWGRMELREEIVEIDDSEWEPDLGADEIYSRLEIEHAQWILEHAQGGFERTETEDGHTDYSPDIESAAHEMMEVCQKYGVDICLRTSKPNDAAIVLSGRGGWMYMDEVRSRAEEETP